MSIKVGDTIRIPVTVMAIVENSAGKYYEVKVQSLRGYDVFNTCPSQITSACQVCDRHTRYCRIPETVLLKDRITQLRQLGIIEED